MVNELAWKWNYINFLILKDYSFLPFALLFSDWDNIYDITCTIRMCIVIGVFEEMNHNKHQREVLPKQYTYTYVYQLS